MHGKNREGCSVGQNQFVVRERIVGADQLFESRASRQVERFEIVVAAQAAQFVQPCDLQSVGLAGRVGHDVGLLEILERGKVELGAAAEHYPQILEFGELENLLHGGERGNFAALEPLQRGEIPDAIDVRDTRFGVDVKLAIIGGRIGDGVETASAGELLVEPLSEGCIGNELFGEQVVRPELREVDLRLVAESASSRLVLSGNLVDAVFTDRALRLFGRFEQSTVLEPYVAQRIVERSDGEQGRLPVILHGYGYLPGPGRLHGRVGSDSEQLTHKSMEVNAIVERSLCTITMMIVGICFSNAN